MAAPRCLQCVEEGAHIRTPWSAHVVIKEILVTTQVGPWVFYGVCAETLDATSSDWTSPDCLLWVFDDGSGPRMWQDTAQPSPFNSEDPEKNFDQIVGHYESNDGECYLAVKWKSCLAPTWERETDMPLSPIDKCPRNHFFVAWNFVAVAPSGGEVTFISSAVLGEPTVWTLHEFRENTPETQPWGVIIEAALDEHNTRSRPRNTNGLRSVTVNLTSQTYPTFNHRLSNNAQSYFRYPK
ncbi:hypothetical protein QSH57_004926 [Fusarium oxysporum f. sp. vasinfectum]|nr:hypothetical protein QSH57_004926 [Fusarium oxysporum f. sp. vasinfectum]